MNKYAPVLITTLNRIDHLRTTIESLKKCHLAEYTDVYIGLDYPPSEKYRDGYEKVCEYLETEDHSVFKSFNIIKRTENYGASKNKRELYSYIIKRYDFFVTMEDDIEVSKNFLNYMNSALEYYKDNDDVIAISGYSYPVQWKHSANSSTLKTNYVAAVWGMGFWKEKYLKLYNILKEKYMFANFKSAYKNKKLNLMSDACLIDYLPSFLSYVKNKKNIPENNFFLLITDVCLRAYLAVDSKFIIMPTKSHTRNHGFDGSGLICGEIKKDKKGDDFADNYDYEQQPIDNSDMYSFIPSTEDYLIENLKIYNYFDRRDKKTVEKLMKEVKKCMCLGSGLYRISWLIKLYCNVVLNKLRGFYSID